MGDIFVELAFDPQVASQAQHRALLLPGFPLGAAGSNEKERADVG